jgi:hypothetical protein
MRVCQTGATSFHGASVAIVCGAHSPYSPEQGDGYGCHFTPTAPPDWKCWRTALADSHGWGLWRDGVKLAEHPTPEACIDAARSIDVQPPPVDDPPPPPVDDPPPVTPVAACDVYRALPGAKLTVSAARGVLANDTGPAPLRPKVTQISFRRASHPFSVAADGAFKLKTLANDKLLQLTYTVTGGDRTSAPAVVVVYVQRGPLSAKQRAVCARVTPDQVREPRADADCSSRKLAGNKWYHPYVPREGVGLVTWRTYVRIALKDRCNHGALRVGMSFDDEAISQKGGKIYVTAVEYKVTKDATWRRLRTTCCAEGSAIVYTDGGHLDLSKTTRVTHVRVKTHLIFGEDLEASPPKRGDVYTPRTYTCDMVKRKCD